MKRLLLATTLLISTSAFAATIQPGDTPIADDSGNEWSISASGSIQENGAWTPGGGGTSALTVANGAVYGLDSHGRGWFKLSGDGQSWSSTSAPAATPTAAAVISTPALPSAAAPQLCGPSTSSTKSYGILPITNGGKAQIVGPDQRVFTPHGVNVMNGMLNPPASTLQSLYQGINFVRLAVYAYDSPEALAPYVTDLTSRGIVVVIENHNNGAGNAGGGQGPIFTGSMLSRESAWYASQAAYWKGNPNVWFGTNNEPPSNDPQGLAQWQLATYQAIRGAGNLSPILLEVIGGPGNINVGLPQSVYSQMSNVAWDLHQYGWTSRWSTDQGTVNAALATMVRSAQRITSSGGIAPPVIIGEYGNSTTGMAIDANGNQNVASVHTSSDIAGTAAWAHAPGNPGDGLIAGSGLSDYGKAVAAFIAKGGSGASICQTAPASVAVATQVPAPANENAQVAAPALEAQIAALQANDNPQPLTVEQAQKLVEEANAALAKVMAGQ
jgi:hypothetical protein